MAPFIIILVGGTLALCAARTAQVIAALLRAWGVVKSGEGDCRE